jgi:hypothetical protein
VRERKRKREREREKERERERERERGEKEGRRESTPALVSIKYARTLSVPHSVSMRDYYINKRECFIPTRLFSLA